TGADIYLREIQDVWTWVRPYFDDRATAAAKQLGLPTEPVKLGALAPRTSARLAAALVRVSLDDDMRRQLTG
ncbi:MAG TPA: endonuclease, partial [Mycobacterium sp.]|nr:endonuclease [Mycobacterium sp.]